MKKNETLFVTNPVIAKQRDIHAEAMQQFNTLFPTLEVERTEALQDRRFVSIAGAQWEGQWANTFSNSVMVEINKTAQGCEDIERQYKSSRYTVEYRDTDNTGDNEAVETINGMYLADFTLSQGNTAQDNAFTEGLHGGYGAWRLTNVYCDDEDEDDDSQKIIWETIIDADQNVFWDPNARLYDKSDAAYCFVISPLSREAFISKFGADKIASWPAEFVKPYYDWYTPEVIRVAEYYRILEVQDTVYKLTHSVTNEMLKYYASDEDYKEDIAEAKKRGYAVTMIKDIKRKECRKWIMSGAELLSEDEGKLIAGGLIPVIPFYGKRVFIDNQERARGHVRLAKDPQRVYNTQISKLVETAAQAPMEVPIFYPEQVMGHEQKWADANIDRAPYRLVNPMINKVDGSIIPLGEMGRLTPPQLSPVLASLIQQSSSDIKELTDAEDGAGQVKANVSEGAMNVAAMRTDDKAALYLDNMKQSVYRAGVIYQAMARDVYFYEGRKVTTLYIDNADKPVYRTAVIGERVSDENGNQRIRNQLGKNEFKVIASVVEQTATRRDKTVKSLMNAVQYIAPFDPEAASMMTATAITNMDGEGIHDLQEYFRSKLVAAGAAKPTPEEQQAIAEAQQRAAEEPPAPEDQLVLASAKQAEALAQKAIADAEEARTKALVNEANVAKIEAETGATQVETLKEVHRPIVENKEKPVEKQAPEDKTAKKPSLLDRFRKLTGK